MRKFIITLVCISIGLILDAQSSFFLSYKRPSHERAFSSVQNFDGSYIIAGEKSAEGYYGNLIGYLLKISSSGQILQEYVDSLTEKSVRCLTIPLPDESNEYLCVGSIDSIAINENFSQVSISIFDSDLNITLQKKYSWQKNFRIIPWQSVLVDDTVVFVMNENLASDLTSGLQSFISVVKYRLPADSISSYKANYLSLCSDLSIKKEQKELDLYYIPGKSILRMNYNLDSLSSDKYNPRFFSTVDLTNIGDSNYIFTGSAVNNINGNFLIGSIKYNLNNIGQDSIYFTSNTDTNFYAGGRQNTTINGNNIFIAGFYNVNAWLFPYNYNPSWVTISKLDLDLNMISTHFYGGDAQYCPYSIIATSDGGCFVTGYSYDYINNLPNNNYELDIFALKTDSDGLITELPDQPQAKAHDAIVYPNPGIEYLNIQSGPQITGAEFYMFDINGNAVIVEKITNTQLKVNTAYLPSGTYPWQIVFKNKVIESGKWVKK